MPRFSRVAPFLLISLAAALSACSSTKPAFQDDQLLSSAPSPFSHGFNYASTDACEASRRALLSQGYMTTMTHNDTVDATKNFQPTIDQHIVVEVHVVCTPADATNTSMVYVNAVQNGYALKKSATSASVGLSILGSVSLPIHSNTDEMVKVSSQTIQSDAFYKRFFDLVGRYLNTVARSEPVPGSGDIKSTPLPPPLEPDPALMNTAAPGASAAPAAAATGVAVLHPAVPPATPVPGTQTAVPAAAASGVHAVFPASPASEATLLTPVLPPPAASAPAAATSPATPDAASAPAGANRAAQPGAAAVPASGAAATQAAAPASGASTTQAAAPAPGAAAVQAAAQPAAASAAAPVTIAAAPTSVANSGTATSSPAPAGGTQNVAAASASGAVSAPASNAAPAAATTH